TIKHHSADSISEIDIQNTYAGLPKHHAKRTVSMLHAAHRAAGDGVSPAISRHSQHAATATAVVERRLQTTSSVSSGQHPTHIAAAQISVHKRDVNPSTRSSLFENTNPRPAARFRP